MAGGDTASALAAGCTVVCKAHPAHPGTSELAARAIDRAARSTGVPPGVFSLLHGWSHDVGLALVRHPLTRAVGFTGSLRGGRALFDAAAARPEPIPVYAEMGSVNPVFLLPSASAERGDAIAQGLAASITLGAGQFCTNPGVVVGVKGGAFEQLTARLGEHIRASEPGVLLYERLGESYAGGLARARERGAGDVAAAAGSPTAAGTAASGAGAGGGSGAAAGSPTAAGTAASGAGAAEGAAAASGAGAGEGTGATEGAGAAGGVRAAPTLLRADANRFVSEPALREEVFGPSSLVVGSGDGAELERVAEALEGQLAATIHGTDAELREHRRLIEILQRKVGRLIFNGYPTGVEVGHAMQHGGPYPASTDGRTTSVGTAAITRFARPVCFQDFPDASLPAALRDRNEAGILRMLDGAYTREDVR